MQTESLKEIVRFSVVGCFATILQYVLYMLFLKTGISEEVSFTLSYAIAWINNLWLTSVFTFRQKISVRKSIGFAVSHGVNYLLWLLCFEAFLQLGCPSQFAPFPVYAICIPLNFLMVRFVFKSRVRTTKQSDEASHENRDASLVS